MGHGGGRGMGGKMNYLNRLEGGAGENHSILCFGMDPVIERFPPSIKGSGREKIVKFYSEGKIQRDGKKVMSLSVFLNVYPHFLLKKL